MVSISQFGKRYYLLYVGFVSGGKFYKFSESNKSRALSLKRQFDLQGIYTELHIQEPKKSNNVQLSFFDKT